METLTKAQTIKIDINALLNGCSEKYLLVEWPEIQKFMDHPRWHECIFCIEIEGHPCPDGAYMVPESLYKEMLYELVN